MQQISQIADIIEETLEEHGLGFQIRPIAEACAESLVKASLKQLATVLGADLTVNVLGDTTLNLGAISGVNIDDSY
jgi:hypothetical protein